MSALGRIDPVLARHRLRTPAAIDGVPVVRCLEVRPYPGSRTKLDAHFELEGGRRVWAAAADGGRRWTSYVEPAHG